MQERIRADRDPLTEDTQSASATAGKASVESPYSWLVAGISLVITSLSFGAITAVPILMKPMSEELRWGRAELASIHTSAFAFAAVACVVMGFASDRVRFFRLALTGAISIGLGLVLTSRASELWKFYIFYGLLVGGLGQGTFFSPITASASRWFDRNRNVAIALITCGQGFGGLIVPVVLRGGANLVGWRDAMAGYGGACFIIMGLGSIVFLKTPPAACSFADKNKNDNATQSAPNWIAYRFAVIQIIFGSIGSFLFIAHFMILCEERQIASFTSSLLMSLMLGTTICSRMVTGFLLNHVSQQRVILWSNVISALGIVIVARGSNSSAIIAIGAMTFGTGFGSSFPAYATLVRDNLPAGEFGYWLSTLWCASFLSAGVGTWMGGYLHDLSGSYGYSLGFAAVAVMTGVVIARVCASPRPVGPLACKAD